MTLPFRGRTRRVVGTSDMSRGYRQIRNYGLSGNRRRQTPAPAEMRDIMSSAHLESRVE